MNDENDRDAPRPAPRGDAAWKAERERVATRNEEARRAARRLREASDREAAERRRVDELRERAELRDLGPPKR